MRSARGSPSLGARIAVHLSVLVVGAGLLRIAVIPAEHCPAVTGDDVRRAVGETISWFERGLRPDGRFTYAYDRGDDRVDPSYNHARHAGVVMSLYQAHLLVGSPEALTLADAGLAFALDAVRVEGDRRAWHPGGDVEAGPNGLLLAALGLRRLATGDAVHDDLMGGIGRFLGDLQQDDGSVHARWDPAAGRSVPVTTIFATGQAAWGWAMLERIFPGKGWGERAGVTLDYLATARDRAEGEVTRYPDHWAAYTLGELPPAMITGDGIDYARRLAGYFGIRIRVETQRTGEGINLFVRWHPGPPAGVGTAMEGIGSLWSIRDERLDDLRPNIEERMVCAAAIMVQRQVTGAEAAASARPDLVGGAWFYRGRTQMDDQQHVLSGLLMVIPVLEEREGRR
jgi:hypothetical protein